MTVGCSGFGIPDTGSNSLTASGGHVMGCLAVRRLRGGGMGPVLPEGLAARGISPLFRGTFEMKISIIGTGNVGCAW